MKKYAIFTAIFAAAFVAGVAARGFTDAKGWTTLTP